MQNLINQPIMQKTFTGANTLTVLANIFLFIFVQTGFFYFIASKQFNNVLESKIDILNLYIKSSPSTREQIKNFLNSDEVKEIQKLAKEQEIKRTQMNKDLIKQKMLPLLLFVTALIVVIIYMMMSNKNNSWSTFGLTEQILLGLVLTAYVTEIMFFFGIVKKYEFYGDYRIMNTFYKSIKEYLNTVGVTDMSQFAKVAQMAEMAKKVQSELPSDIQNKISSM